MAIPELNVTPKEEAEIWAEFESWGAHFKKRLRANGIEFLIRRLEKLQTLLNSSNEDMWYIDYSHFLSARDALGIIGSHIRSQEFEKFSEQLVEFDAFLQSRWIKGETICPDPPKPQERFWWYYNGRPKGVSAIFP